MQQSSVYALGCVFTVVAGVFLSIQSGVNSTLGATAGKSFASVISFSTGLGALVIFYLVDVYGVGDSGPTTEKVRAVPWWGWIGGLLGAFYVAIVIIFAPKLGAGTLTGIFVSAQLTTSTILDAKGWVGFKRKPLQWPRLLGLVLMLMGVTLITYFDGTRTNKGTIPGTEVQQDNPASPVNGAPIQLGAHQMERDLVASTTNKVTATAREADMMMEAVAAGPKKLQS